MVTRLKWYHKVIIINYCQNASFLRPVETISSQIGMHAIGKLRISMCCTLMCFLSWWSEAYNILGTVGVE